MSRETCEHPHGDMVNGNWLCGHCYVKLHEQPKKYKMVRNLSTRNGDDDVLQHKYRQEVIPTPTSTDANGVTLSEFVGIMARRLVALTGGQFTIPDAMDYAIDILRGFDEPFGNPELDWSRDGAWEMVREDLQYWDDEGSGANQ